MIADQHDAGERGHNCANASGAAQDERQHDLKAGGLDGISPSKDLAGHDAGVVPPGQRHS